ncbi:MAG: serine/threonine protein kinase [Actinobacteria bacterium]|nr:MAG: serine/threonine protein kinase [Actinomycetota bacterium]
MSDLPPGSEFAGHRIEEVVGHGGMGVVYRAVHVALGRTVALKILAPELAGNDEFQTRFRQESKLAASIDHPNVIPIFDAGEEGDSLYVTMRFVAGTDLRQLAASGGLDPTRAARIVAQAAEALDAAHARGLVHRDVKPGNVLIESHGGQEHAFLTDFGLTKQVSSDPSITETGNWLGTVDYAAPEQIRARPLDRRADVYALGGVLYWALTGRVPYPREGDMAKMYAHLNDPPPPLGDSIPAELASVVATAMAKDPADRYQKAGDLGRAALAAAGRAPSAADRNEAATRPLPVAPASPSAVRPPPTRTLPVPPARRNRIAAVGALGVGLVLLILALAGAFSGGGGGSGSSGGKTGAARRPLPRRGRGRARRALHARRGAAEREQRAAGPDRGDRRLQEPVREARGPTRLSPQRAAHERPSGRRDRHGPLRDLGRYRHHHGPHRLRARGARRAAPDPPPSRHTRLACVRQRDIPPGRRAGAPGNRGNKGETGRA